MSIRRAGIDHAAQPARSSWAAAIVLAPLYAAAWLGATATLGAQAEAQAPDDKRAQAEAQAPDDKQPAESGEQNSDSVDSERPDRKADTQGLDQDRSDRKDRGNKTKQTDGSTIKAATRRFRRGVLLFGRGAYRGALIEFQRAYEIAPNFRLLYNVAQTHMELQEHLEARETFLKYLEEGGDAVDLQRRRRVSETVEMLQDFVAEIRVRVNEPDAQVFVDDEPIGKSPLSEPVPVNLGRHRISVAALDGRSAARLVELAGGESVTVELELQPVLAGSKPATQDVPRLSRRRKGSVGLFSSAFALALGAAASAAVQGAAQDDFEKELATFPIDDEQALTTARSRARRLAITTDALGAVAVGAAVAGLVLWLTDKRRSDAARRRSHDRSRWQGGFTLDSRSAGLTARLGF